MGDTFPFLLPTTDRIVTLGGKCFRWSLCPEEGLTLPVSFRHSYLLPTSFKQSQVLPGLLRCPETDAVWKPDLPAYLAICNGLQAGSVAIRLFGWYLHGIYLPPSKTTNHMKGCQMPQMWNLYTKMLCVGCSDLFLAISKEPWKERILNLNSDDHNLKNKDNPELYYNFYRYNLYLSFSRWERWHRRNGSLNSSVKPGKLTSCCESHLAPSLSARQTRREGGREEKREVPIVPIMQ